MNIKIKNVVEKKGRTYYFFEEIAKIGNLTFKLHFEQSDGTPIGWNSNCCIYALNGTKWDGVADCKEIGFHYKNDYLASESASKAMKDEFLNAALQYITNVFFDEDGEQPTAEDITVTDSRSRVDDSQDRVAFDGSAFLLGTDGSVTKIQPANGTDFQLDECYDLIGCELIEVVYIYDVLDADGKEVDSYILICDEEGALKNDFEFNSTASIIAHTDIVGNCILCPSDMLK